MTEMVLQLVYVYSLLADKLLENVVVGLVCLKKIKK